MMGKAGELFFLDPSSERVNLLLLVKLAEDERSGSGLGVRHLELLSAGFPPWWNLRVWCTVPLRRSRGVQLLNQTQGKAGVGFKST